MTAYPLPGPVAQAFAQQADSCRDLGSPFVAAICALIAERGLPDGQTRRRIATWPGLAHSRADAVPLRFAGALHRLVLDGADPELMAVFPPAELDTLELWQAIRTAVVTHDAFIDAYLDSPPQTNEVARAAMLLPALLTAHGRHGMPLRLMELGASAGLNQNLDRFRYDYGQAQWGETISPVVIECQWRGDAAFPANRDLHIDERLGCDIAPVPVASDADRKRLRSYVWPDQTHRLERLAAALDLVRIHPPRIDKIGAGDWLDKHLSPLPTGRHTVLFHTIMWQYLPDNERARAENTIRCAGRDAAADRPLSWLRFEADEREPGAAILLTQWAGDAADGITRLVGRGDFHGRWLHMAE